MSQSERNKRLRLAVRKLNKERKRQAVKVDILCNDLVGALQEFLRRLSGIDFAARFYKGLLGATDLHGLLVRAGRMIQEELPGVKVAFFMRQAEGCELHEIDRESSAGAAGHAEQGGLEDYFTPELAAAVCKSNKVCAMDDLFGLGLDGNLKQLNSYSAATVPLHDLGRSLGFVLLSRPATQPLSGDELDRVALVTCGLAQAIHGCRAPAPSRP